MKLKEAQSGTPVALHGILVGHHNGQAIIEFDAGDDPDGGQHAEMLTPVQWHVTNSVAYFEPHLKDRVRRLAGMVAAKQAATIADLLATVDRLQDRLHAAEHPMEVKEWK